MAKQSSARVSAQISSAAVAANEAFLMARYAHWIASSLRSSQ
jgi:hypothetical protein